MSGDVRDMPVPAEATPRKGSNRERAQTEPSSQGGERHVGFLGVGRNGSMGGQPHRSGVSDGRRHLRKCENKQEVRGGGRGEVVGCVT